MSYYQTSDDRTLPIVGSGITQPWLVRYSANFSNKGPEVFHEEVINQAYDIRQGGYTEYHPVTNLEISDSESLKGAKDIFKKAYVPIQNGDYSVALGHSLLRAVSVVSGEDIQDVQGRRLQIVINPTAVSTGWRSPQEYPSSWSDFNEQCHSILVGGETDLSGLIMDVRSGGAVTDFWFKAEPLGKKALEESTARLNPDDSKGKKKSSKSKSSSSKSSNSHGSSAASGSRRR